MSPDYHQQTRAALVNGARDLLTNDQFDALLDMQAELANQFLGLGDSPDFEAHISAAVRKPGKPGLGIVSDDPSLYPAHITSLDDLLRQRGGSYARNVEWLPVALFIMTQVQPADTAQDPDIPAKLVLVAGGTPDGRANQVFIEPAITAEGFLRPGNTRKIAYNPDDPLPVFSLIRAFYEGWIGELAAALKASNQPHHQWGKSRRM